MAASITFTGPGGVDPMTHILNIGSALQPTVGDGLYAGQLLRSRILERTYQGIDVNGVPFAPYAENHPYYYYPFKGGTAKQKKAVRRALARTIKVTGARPDYGVGGVKTRGGTGIRFSSYGDAKRSFGRGDGVDLFGLEQHTHMLNTIMVKVGGETDQDAQAMVNAPETTAHERPTPTNDLRVGFYGPEAERARGNNEGSGKLPERHFFDANQQDIDLMGESIKARMLTRARAGR